MINKLLMLMKFARYFCRYQTNVYDIIFSFGLYNIIYVKFTVVLYVTLLN